MAEKKPKINDRRNISAARQATNCRACGTAINYCDLATLIVIQVGTRAFTPLVCRPCGRKSDADLLHDLILQAGCECTRTPVPHSDYLRIVSQLDPSVK